LEARVGKITGMSAAVCVCTPQTINTDFRLLYYASFLTTWQAWTAAAWKCMPQTMPANFQNCRRCL